MLNKRTNQPTPTYLECIGEIEKSGHTLRQALLSRNTDAIWKAIALQEESLSHLRHCRARAGAETDSARPGASEPAELDAPSQELMKRTRSVLRTNRTLARAFLDIIDKTLASIASGQAGGPIVYNQAGKVDPFSAPLFVQQRG